jgi:SAM-dependent methyltransferase
MLDRLKPKSGIVNGRLWGQRATDWAQIQEPQFTGLYAGAFDRLGVTRGHRLLDVGCGSGLACAIAADRGARVAGIDASQELLAIARSRVPEGEFQCGDMEQPDVAGESFDVVTGFNSFQYAGNPVEALREAGRVAKRGGAVLVATWSDPARLEAVSVISALKALLPPPPAGAPGPFALSDEAALRRFAADAELGVEAVFEIDCPFSFPDEATALRGWNASGVAARAIEHAGQEAVVAAHRAAIAPFRQPDGSFRIGAAFRCLLARA